MHNPEKSRHAPWRTSHIDTDVRPPYKISMALLETWMRKNSFTDEKLAERLGVSRVHASRLRRRICLPSKDVALKLQNLTRIPAAKLVFEERTAPAQQGEAA